MQKKLRRAKRREAAGKNPDDPDSGDEGMATDSDSGTDSDASDEEDIGEKIREFDKNTGTVGTKDDKMRTTTRNLRIREDTAKYLLNLDTSSAFYDPKSRSMRDNPLKHLKDEEQHLFKGDNASRTSGDCKGLEQLERFAWEAYKHGEQTHAIALPTQAHKLQQVFKDRTEQAKEEKKEQLP